MDAILARAWKNGITLKFASTAMTARTLVRRPMVPKALAALQACPSAFPSFDESPWPHGLNRKGAHAALGGRRALGGGTTHKVQEILSE